SAGPVTLMMRAVTIDECGHGRQRRRAGIVHGECPIPIGCRQSEGFRSTIQLLPRYRPEHAVRPGVVTGLCGIVFQDDGRSVIGRLFIRPFEALDRWVAGIPPSRERRPLAMHAGLHVVLEDGREVVAEQLVGTLYMDLQGGLNWTPIDEFRSRDRGGWDLTLPATTFRRVDDRVVDEVVSRLNTIEGRAFIGEDCTAFVERAFG